MSLNLLTLVHILISLAAIGAGCVVVGGMLAGKTLPPCTKTFLTTTVATSVTGFFFPLKGFTPAVAVGVISLMVLALALYALLGGKLAGGWLKVYMITALTALYLNVFVLVAQLFQKVPALQALAPTQQEPPFAITQLLVLATFIAIGVMAYGRIRRGTS